jgi:hypothetical protein
VAKRFFSNTSDKKKKKERKKERKKEGKQESVPTRLGQCRHEMLTVRQVRPLWIANPDRKYSEEQLAEPVRRTHTT